MILLDTDVIVDLWRKLPQAIGWLSSISDEDILLPGYVVMELVQGCQSKAQLQMIEQQLLSATVVWPTPETCDEALSTYARLRFSHGVGMLDALVGHLAVALDTPLHTFNQKHYAAIPGLNTIQPYQR